MSNYQDKINNYVNNLSSQSSAYNAAMGSVKDAAQDAIMSKVGAHADYMAQIGGIVSGTSLASHGAYKGVKTLHKAVTKYRANKANKLKGGNETERSSVNDADTAMNQEIAGEARPAAETAEPVTEEALDHSEMVRGIRQNVNRPGETQGVEQGVEDEADDAGGAAADAAPDLATTLKGLDVDVTEGGGEGSTLASFGGEGLSEAETGGRFGLKEGLSNMGQTTEESVDLPQINTNMASRFGARAATGPQPPAPEAESEIQPARPAPAQAAQEGVDSEIVTQGEEGGTVRIGQTTGREAVDSVNPNEIGGRVQEAVTQKAGDISSEANQLASKVESGGEAISNLGGEASDVAANLAKQGGSSLLKAGGDAIASQTAEKVAGSMIGEGLGYSIGAAAAEFVPVVGELAGIGMLIKGLVDAHSEKSAAEDNPTQVDVSQESAGGFDAASMLKTNISGVAGIV